MQFSRDAQQEIDRCARGRAQSRCSRGKFIYPGMRPRAVKCNFANPNSAPESQIRSLMYRKYQTNELSRRFKRVVTIVACWSARPRALTPVSRRFVALTALLSHGKSQARFFLASPEGLIVVNDSLVRYSRAISFALIAN